MLLKDRVAVVTGGARGIGRAVCERFVREGARVVVADLDRAEGERVAAALGAAGGQAIAVEVDVARRASVQALVAAAEARFGRVDILVNNAGIAGRSLPIEDLTDDDFDSVMAIDVRSVFLCCQAVLRGMKARGWGRIVNVASIAGKEGNPNMLPYSTAKAAVIGLTKSLGKEVATSGVLVNAIAPAVIETEILKQVTPEQVKYMVQRIPMGRVGKPEEVAALVTWLSSDEASFSTGQCYDISGGRATY